MKIARYTARTPDGMIVEGQVYDDHAEAVRNHPEMFADPDEYAEQQMPRTLVVGPGDRMARPVEEATANPGESRKRAKKAAKKKA